MNKLIFLDVDGVICTIRDRFSKFDRWCLKLLYFILYITKANIVVSSEWRLKTLEDTKAKFLQAGFSPKWIHRVIGQTPNLFYKDGGRLPRGIEIKKWLYENGCRYDYKEYVILDDDSDMLYEQRKRFVRTNIYFGLTPYTTLKAIFKLFYQKELMKRLRWKIRYWLLEVYLFFKRKQWT